MIRYVRSTPAIVSFMLIITAFVGCGGGGDGGDVQTGYFIDGPVFDLDGDGTLDYRYTYIFDANGNYSIR